MVKVHARYLLVKSKSTGVDPLVDRILSGRPEDADVKALYEKARDIYLSPIKKSYLEACLLASSDLERIYSLIEIPVPLITLYRDMFFNVVGLDKLSLIEVIESSASPDEQGMKIWALNQGLDFIAWRLGKAVSISPVAGLQDLYTLSVFKSKEALFSGNASEASRNATTWTKLSMDLARLLKAWVTDADAAKSDIEMALRTLDPNFDSFDSLPS